MSPEHKSGWHRQPFHLNRATYRPPPAGGVNPEARKEIEKRKEQKRVDSLIREVWDE